MTTPTVFKTQAGTRYLKEPGVRLAIQPKFDPRAMRDFIAGFEEFDADEYVDDFFSEETLSMDGVHDYPRFRPQKLSDGDGATKAAGQLCYMSFGEKRTKNDEAAKYHDNVKSSGHGSLYLHVGYTFLIWGIDRACSHELVRHMAGTGYSQLSQRYVSGKLLRFVERPEYQKSERLHFEFESWIDRARAQYDLRAELLMMEMKDELEQLPPTDRRKAVNQAARNCLPNETETAMFMTANARAWRHVIEMRASLHADRPISELAQRAYEQLVKAAPILFDDYSVKVRESDGRRYIETPHRKV